MIKIDDVLECSVPNLLGLTRVWMPCSQCSPVKGQGLVLLNLVGTNYKVWTVITLITTSITPKEAYIIDSKGLYYKTFFGRNQGTLSEGEGSLHLTSLYYLV
jgi:hypothetical protein